MSLMRPIIVEDKIFFIIIIIITVWHGVYDFRTGTIRPLDVISRILF